MLRWTTLFTALTLFALMGAAAAQPPVDYTLYCTAAEAETELGDEVDVEAAFEIALEDAVMIGVATEVAGQMHVWLNEDWACDEDDAVVVAVARHDASIVVEVDVEIDAEGVVTMTFLFVDESDESADAGISGTATALPQVAIDGMANAHARRTAAFENRNRGAETSAAARAAAGVGERPQVDLEEIEDEIDDEDDEDDEDDGRPALPDLPEPADSGRR